MIFLVLRAHAADREHSVGPPER